MPDPEKKAPLALPFSPSALSALSPATPQPSPAPPLPSALVYRQRLFTLCLGMLLEHARLVVCPRYGVALRMGEGHVADSIDKPGEDTPHLRQGTHMKRLGQDFVMDLLGHGGGVVWGEHPAWHALGAYWKGLHPLCRWGGDFRNAAGTLVGDWGHFSVETPEGRS